MNTEELQTLEIPLSKLLAWNDNVRRTGVEEGIGELAGSIAAVGLLQGLVVKKEPRGEFAVIAGRRRLLALSRLAEEGKIKATMPIPCRIAPKDADVPEISLTENVMRVPMHPADEFEAFQRLIAAGKSVADVAARFGVMLEQQKREWLEKLATAMDLWTWCLEQDQQTMLELLAYCVARTINGVRAKSDAENSGSRLEHANAVARALAFDMGKWFTPTAENFFNKIPKSTIAEALAEAGKPTSPETLKLKKPELAAFAESEIKGTNWLPEPIRIPAAG